MQSMIKTCWITSWKRSRTNSRHESNDSTNADVCYEGASVIAYYEVQRQIGHPYEVRGVFYEPTSSSFLQKPVHLFTSKSCIHYG